MNTLQEIFIKLLMLSITAIIFYYVGYVRGEGRKQRQDAKKLKKYYDSLPKASRL